MHVRTYWRTRIRTRTHARGIYTRGKRERGSVTRAQAHARATTVPCVSLRWENLGVHHFDGKSGSVNGAGRIIFPWWIIPAAVVALD